MMVLIFALLCRMDIATSWHDRGMPSNVCPLMFKVYIQDRLQAKQSVTPAEGSDASGGEAATLQCKPPPMSTM